MQLWKNNWQKETDNLPVKYNTPGNVLTGIECPQLCQLGKDVNEGIMTGQIIFRQAAMNMLTFIGEIWIPEQMAEFAKVAYEEYYWFSTAELKQFMQRVKNGAYSSNKLIKPVILMEFLREYAEERLNFRYEHYSQLKPISRRIITLSIDKAILTDRGKKIARYMFKCCQDAHDEWIKKRDEFIANSLLTKDDYKEEKEERHFSQKLKKIKSEWKG